jgi:very-short-patch-repair endonuclease
MNSMRVPRDANLRRLHFAKQMRKDATDAEKPLWSILRNRALAGFKFRRQHPVGGFIVEFYCVSTKLAVECDGGQHVDSEAVGYDAKRTERLNELGVRVLRFWDDDILKHSDIVAEEILRHLQQPGPSPQPSPGVPGEGVRPPNATP